MNTLRITNTICKLAMLGSLVLTSGCSGDDDSAPTTPGTGGTGGSTSQKASVRVMHLSPDAPGVDVFVNAGKDPVVQNLTFPNGTPYLEVPAGTYTFDVAATGSSAADAVLTIKDLGLAAGTSYTAVALDKLASITALPLVDDYSNLAAGKIRIRAIHAAAAVGQVDIWNITDPQNPAALYENVDFGVAGNALDVPAGAYKLGIDVNDDKKPDLTFSLPSLPAGTAANVFATNDAAGKVFLVAELRDGSTVRIDAQ